MIAIGTYARGWVTDREFVTGEVTEVGRTHVVIRTWSSGCRASEVLAFALPDIEIVGGDREESDTCEKLTAGCPVHHTRRDSPCDCW